MERNLGALLPILFHPFNIAWSDQGRNDTDDHDDDGNLILAAILVFQTCRNQAKPFFDTVHDTSPIRYSRNHCPMGKVNNGALEGTLPALQEKI